MCSCLPIRLTNLRRWPFFEKFFQENKNQDHREPSKCEIEIRLQPDCIINVQPKSPTIKSPTINTPTIEVLSAPHFIFGHESNQVTDTFTFDVALSGNQQTTKKSNVHDINSFSSTALATQIIIGSQADANSSPILPSIAEIPTANPQPLPQTPVRAAAPVVKQPPISASEVNTPYDADDDSDSASDLEDDIFSNHGSNSSTPLSSASSTPAVQPAQQINNTYFPAAVIAATPTPAPNPTVVTAQTILPPKFSLPSTTTKKAKSTTKKTESKFKWKYKYEIEPLPAKNIYGYRGWTTEEENALTYFMVDMRYTRTVSAQHLNAIFGNGRSYSSVSSKWRRMS